MITPSNQPYTAQADAMLDGAAQATTRAIDSADRAAQKSFGAMAGGVAAEHLPAQHVGDPGKRVPIVMFSGEGPNHALPGKSGLHLGVVGQIARIVVVDEAVV